MIQKMRTTTKKKAAPKKTRPASSSDAPPSEPAGHDVRVTADKNGKPTRVEIGRLADLSALPGHGRKLGGSGDDEFNAYISGQASGAMWDKATTVANAEKTTKLAITAAMGIAPQDEIEGMIAAQLWGLHCAAMECFRRAMLDSQTIESRAMNLNAANKCSRTFAALGEALNRHRGKGQQAIRVEHVTVNGGQAIVGSNVHPQGGGIPYKSEGQPHAQAGHASVTSVPCQDTSRNTMPITKSEGPEAM